MAQTSPIDRRWAEPLLSARRLAVPPPSPWVEAAWRLVCRQAVTETFGMPGYGQTLRHPQARAFAAAPRDFRPTDPAIGRSVLAGRFAYGGAFMEVGTVGDPWNRPTPGRAFAVELHRFTWLPHLVSTGDRGAREGLRLVQGWRELFGAWSPFAWGRETLPRRTFNLACAAKRLSSGGSAMDGAALADLLARQSRHLLRLPDDRGWAAEQSVAAAVAGAALAGPAGEGLLKRALGRLKRALSRTVLADGCHASRNPEATLELLFDLLTLDDALLQRGETAPSELSRALDRLTVALRFFTLGDGRLAAFQGGEPASKSRCAAARAHDDAEGVAPLFLPDGRYHRVSGQMLQVIVDAGQPALGPFGTTACVQPLAIEVCCGKDRLITNGGWSLREPDRQGFRLPAAASTVSLGETSPMEPMSGKLAAILGPRLEGKPFRVEARRHDGDGVSWVELAHDGWSRRFGLLHERRLYVDGRIDELRGEDRFTPAPGVDEKPLAAPYAIRFHLAPDVQVSLARDKKSVLLRGPSGRGWWFRNDAAEVLVEPSMQFQNGAPKKSTQVVLRGVARTDTQSRVRWKLGPAGGPEDFAPYASTSTTGAPTLDAPPSDPQGSPSE
jgi:uncharacterized heparinase superfamily protein